MNTSGVMMTGGEGVDLSVGVPPKTWFFGDKAGGGEVEAEDAKEEFSERPPRPSIPASFSDSASIELCSATRLSTLLAASCLPSLCSSFARAC